MVTLYTGTPGSGKSLHAAHDIYWWLRRGRHVLANFDINTKQIKSKNEINFIRFENNKIKPDFFVEYSRNYIMQKKAEGKNVKEGELKIIFDEAQIVFSARAWQTLDPKWLSFFTQSRKYRYDIILICQFDQMVDKQIRSIVEYEYKHRKFANFGSWGFILNLLFGGKTHAAIKYWYPIQQKIGSEIFHAKKKYYSIYDTFGDFELGDHILSKKEIARIGNK